MGSRRRSSLTDLKARRASMVPDDIFDPGDEEAKLMAAERTGPEVPQVHELNPNIANNLAPVRRSSFRQMLDELGLTKYQQGLEAGGYETPQDLCAATLGDLINDIDVKKPHAKRILAAAAKHVQEHGIAAAPAMNDSEHAELINSAAIKRGKLSKQGRLRNNWKEREFVLTSAPKCLFYYTPEEGAPRLFQGKTQALKGKLDFEGMDPSMISVERILNVEEWRFQVKCGQRTLQMAAHTEAEMTEWMRELSSCLEVPITEIVRVDCAAEFLPLKTEGKIEGALQKKGKEFWNYRFFSFDPGSRNLQYFGRENADRKTPRGFGVVTGIIGISDSEGHKNNRFMVTLHSDDQLSRADGSLHPSAELELAAATGEEKSLWLRSIAAVIREQNVVIYENERLLKSSGKQLGAWDAPADRPKWSNENGRCQLLQEDVELPPNPSQDPYAMQWAIGCKTRKSSVEGGWRADEWKFGSNFHTKLTTKRTQTHQVRRRRWVRLCILEPGCYHRDIKDKECDEKRCPGRTHCLQHGCSVDGCEKGKAAGDGAFCSNHECAFYDCRTQNLGQSLFCLEHVCAVDDCEKGRAATGDGTFCAEHECSSSSGCKTRNQHDHEGGSTFCSEHGCSFFSCEQHKAAGGGIFCSNHECFFDTCREQREERSNYCSKHECAVSSCNTARGDGTYCPEHECSFSDCKTRNRNSDVTQENEDPAGELFYLNTQTGETTWEKPKPNGSTFCSVHGCAADNCEEERQETGSFCLNHECSSDSCIDQRKREGTFCSRHECAFATCNAARGDGAFCSNHECLSGNCREQRNEGSGRFFCPNHECASPSCSTAREDGGTFCSGHECRVADCKTHNQLHSGRESTFCTEHGCLDGHCKQQRKLGAGAKYCSDHECMSDSCNTQRKDKRGSTFCLTHECSVGSCKLENNQTSDKCENCDKLSNLANRVGNSRYGTGDAFCLQPEFSNIQVTKMQWFDAPLKGAGVFQNGIGCKHSIVVLHCAFIGKEIATFELNLEKSQIDEDCEYTTVGTHRSLLLSKGGTPNLLNLIKDAKLRRTSDAEIHLVGQEQVTLRAIIDVADSSGKYSLEDSNCHHMALHVFNFIRAKKNLQPLEEKDMPNAFLIRSVRAVLKKAPGVRAAIGHGSCASESNCQAGQSNYQGPRGINGTREVKPEYVLGSATCAVSAAVAGGVATGVLAGPAALVAGGVAVAGAAKPAQAALKAVGLSIRIDGHAFPQHNPCQACGGDTWAKCCPCGLHLCEECTKKPLHRDHLKQASAQTETSGKKTTKGFFRMPGSRC
jgi:hypothetical protein